MCCSLEKGSEIDCNLEELHNANEFSASSRVVTNMVCNPDELHDPTLIVTKKEGANKY